MNTERPTYCPNCGRVDVRGDELAREFSEILDYLKSLEYIANRAGGHCCKTCDEMRREAEKIRAITKRLRKRFWALNVDLTAPEEG